MTEPLSLALQPLPARGEAERCWRALDRTGAHSFFASWPWIGGLLRHLPPAAEPMLATLAAHDVVCGAALLVRPAKRRAVLSARALWLNASGDAETDRLAVEHNGFAGFAPDDPAPWRALFRWFATQDETDELVIPGAVPHVADAAPAAAVLAEERPVSAFRVDLGAVRNGGGTGAVLSANARQQLSRSRRALARLGPIALDRAQSADEALQFFDALKRLHVRSWTRRGRRHAFANPVFEPFHRALIAEHFQGGAVELLRLKAGGRELAYLYNFRRNGSVYAYQSGIDDAEPQLRSGYVAHALAIEAHAEDGASVYDFMAGENRLKASFGTERYQMAWHRITRPLLRFRAERAVRALRERL